MFHTIILELFLPLRPFKKTASIRQTTISAQILHESKKPLTAQRYSHRCRSNHGTIEPLNKKSQITQEYGLLPADARQQKGSYFDLKSHVIVKCGKGREEIACR